MIRRILTGVALTMVASSAFAFQLRAIYQTPNQPLLEGAGLQTVTVELEREVNDPQVSCLVEVTANAQQFANPPPDAATPGVDYTPTTTIVTISLDASATIASQTFDVPVLDDSEAETTEFFAATVSNVEALDCGGDPTFNIAGESPVPIFDDDTAAGWTFSGEPFQTIESTQSAVISLIRQGGTAGELTVFFTTEDGSAIDGQDYTSVTGSVTWFDGESGIRTFTVPVIDDADTEGDETVLIRAGTDSDFVLATETTLTILDDESPASASFSASQSNTAEDADSVTLTLVRAGSTAGALSVDYATQDGSATAGEDYVAAAGTVSWADGDGADKTITITLLEDGDNEEAEDFVVVLSNITGNAVLGGNSAITVTIDASDVARDISDITNLTPNQFELATWFDQTCPRLQDLAIPTPDQQDLADICTLVRSPDTDDATVRQALDAINPEELLVSSFNALRLTAVQHGNLSQRLNALRAGASGINLAGLQLDVGGQTIAGTAIQEMFDKLTGGGASADEAAWGRWGGFLNGRIATGDKDDTDNESGFEFDLYALTAGVDYRVRENFIVGLSGGWGSVDSEYDDQGGTLDIDSWNAAAYLTYFRDQRFYLDALATYGSNDYDSERRIVFGEGAAAIDRTGVGTTDGKQFSLGFGTGWDFNRGALTFGPHGGAYYYDVNVDGFSETGAGGLNVAVDDQSTQSFTVNAGGHISYAVLTGWGVLVPNAKVDWVHEFEDNSETLAFRFINDPFVGDPSDPSPTITLRSDRPDANYFIWSIGASAQFIYGLSGFLNYQSYAGYSNVSLGEWTMGARWEKTW